MNPILLALNRLVTCGIGLNPLEPFGTAFAQFRSAIFDF